MDWQESNFDEFSVDQINARYSIGLAGSLKDDNSFCMNCSKIISAILR